MPRFDFVPTPIAGLMLVQYNRLEDSRGFLSRLYCAEEFKMAGIHKSIAQVNHTLTRRKGALRGMHFQLPPQAETKLVSCLRGEIFDVAVDLRKNSPTFLKWHGEVLSAANLRSLLIPEGFAHGFQALTENCELLYLHTAPFSKASEGGVRHDDPVIGIRWPLPVADLSDRDRLHAWISAEFDGVPRQCD
jgi:dTDP-4-dehydrorhamnose 3,5-epimerase